MCVADVDPDGVVEMFGVDIRKGDRIMRVNGIEGHAEEMIREINDCAGVLDLDILRGAEIVMHTG